MEVLEVSQVASEPKVGCERPSSAPAVRSPSWMDTPLKVSLTATINSPTYTASMLSVKNWLSQHKYFMKRSDTLVYNQNKNDILYFRKLVLKECEKKLMKISLFQK